jgi:3-deoxy-D-manno-octulosonic-acid transferase
MRRIAYTLLLYALLPGALWHLVWRARRQPGYLRHVPERFGHYRQAPPAEPVIWVHAVSVGETHAAEPLIRALRERHPDHRIVLTHMTPTGRETGAMLFKDQVLSCYLPYDFPGAIARFLDRFRPRAGILMETEIWPNLIHACHARGVPLYLVNARLSEKSWSRYRRFERLARASLGLLAGIAAQGEDDARRLRDLGAHAVSVDGNLKFDSAVPAAQRELGLKWRAACGARPVLLAASTRDGEEALLLDAMQRCAPPDLLVMIVPRHPQRFDEVAALIERRGYRCRRRTAGFTDDPGVQVVLGDSMGEMFAYYAACDVAFIGGSLLPYGAHNLIEACALGKPVLVGPSTYNFADAVESAVAAGAALQIADADQLMREAGRLLLDRDARRRMGDAARAFCTAHQGATQRVLDMLCWENREKGNRK